MPDMFKLKTKRTSVMQLMLKYPQVQRLNIHLVNHPDDYRAAVRISRQMPAQFALCYAREVRHG